MGLGIAHVSYSRRLVVVPTMPSGRPRRLVWVSTFLREGRDCRLSWNGVEFYCNFLRFSNEMLALGAIVLKDDCQMVLESFREVPGSSYRYSNDWFRL